MTPLYSVGCWDCEANRYQPFRFWIGGEDPDGKCLHRRITARSKPSLNLTRAELRQCLRDLRGKPKPKDRKLPKAAWRRRTVDVGYNWSPPIPWVDEVTTIEYESDLNTLVERTDGKDWFTIMRGWKR